MPSKAQRTTRINRLSPPTPPLPTRAGEYDQRGRINVALEGDKELALGAAAEAEVTLTAWVAACVRMGLANPKLLGRYIGGGS